MILTSVFITLAVGVLAFALITQPLFETTAPERKPIESSPVDALKIEYQKRLTWLADLEVEFKTGKIDNLDYQDQGSHLQNEADDLLTQLRSLQNDLPQEDAADIENMIQDRRMQRVERSAGFCVQCGGPLQVSDQFCPKCGLKLK